MSQLDKQMAFTVTATWSLLLAGTIAIGVFAGDWGWLANAIVATLISAALIGLVIGIMAVAERVFPSR